MRRLLIFAAIALYLGSLALPAITTSGRDPVPGWLLLLYGPFGLAGLQEVRWLVNPLFWLTVGAVFVSKGPSIWGLLLAGAGLALALSCFTHQVSWVAGDSGSPSSVAAKLQVGAYLWIAAQVVAFAAMLVWQRARALRTVSAG